jgi:hypothetical protein
MLKIQGICPVCAETGRLSGAAFSIHPAAPYCRWVCRREGPVRSSQLQSLELLNGPEPGYSITGKAPALVAVAAPLPAASTSKWI